MELPEKVADAWREGARPRPGQCCPPDGHAHVQLSGHEVLSTRLRQMGYYLVTHKHGPKLMPTIWKWPERWLSGQMNNGHLHKCVAAKWFCSQVSAALR